MDSNLQICKESEIFRSVWHKKIFIDFKYIQKTLEGLGYDTGKYDTGLRIGMI